MGEISFGHEIVGLNDPVNVSTMNPYSNTHNHVLWALSDTSIDTKEIRALEGLETEAMQDIRSMYDLQEWEDIHTSCN
jgi:hypothetical protein